MVSATLMAAALVAVLSAAAYATVAWKIRKRTPADPHDKWALDHFVLWWAATAANILVAGLLYLAAAFDRITLGMQLADSILQRIVLALSLWGLLTYLLYLVTGKRYGRLTGLLYTGHAMFMVAALLYSGPNGVIVGAWRTDLTYATEPTRILDLVNLVLIVLLPVIACIAYLIIGIRLPKDDHREQRYRAIIVSTALIFWWTVAVTAGQRALLELEWLQLVNRALGLCAALAIVLAYNPPSMIRRRWASHAANPTK